MYHREPYERTGPTFECTDCGHRFPPGDRPTDCDCGGVLRNVATPQE